MQEVGFRASEPTVEPNENERKGSMNILFDGLAANGRTRTLVGAARVEAGIHVRHYEVAAWHTEVEIPEPIWVPVFNHGYWNTWSAVGTVVSSHTPALYGGVPFGHEPQGEHHPDVGKQMAIGGQADKFGLANMVDAGRAVLFDGFKVVEVSTYKDGSPMLVVEQDPDAIRVPVACEDHHRRSHWDAYCAQCGLRAE